MGFLGLGDWYLLAPITAPKVAFDQLQPASAVARLAQLYRHATYRDQARRSVGIIGPRTGRVITEG